MNIALKPQGKWVLIEAVKPDSGPIVIPSGANGDRANQRSPELYRVLDVGEGRMASDGSIVPWRFEPGDEVFLSPEAPLVCPAAIMYDTDDKFVIDGSQVMCVVTGRDGNKLPIRNPEIVTARRALVH